MIVDITLEYLDDGGNAVDKAILIGNIIEHCHYIKPHTGILDRIYEIVDEHGTPHIKEIYQSYREYLSPPDEMVKHLTTITLADFTKANQRIILFKPSELLLENAPYEWNIYKNLIRAYTQHPKFGNVFKYLQHKVENCWLVPENAGGWTNMRMMTILKNTGEYHRQYRKKVCIVFDRDTADDAHYHGEKRPLFQLLTNKAPDQTTEDDITKLDYDGSYVWHMLWKRAIENYFPPEKFEELGVDMTEARECGDYDYYKFKDDEHGYDKKMMEKISDGMAMSDFENNCRTFVFHNSEYSEFCLLLLKIAKIV